MAAVAFWFLVRRWAMEKVAERAVVAGAAAILADATTDADTDVDGIGATGDVAGEAGSEGGENTDENARPIPGSTADARTEECEDCNDCKPRDGHIFQPGNRNYRVGGGEWAFYQLYIANMGGHPSFAMANEKVQEWKYNNTEFDGFWSYSCTLVEAKKGYDGFLIRSKNGSWVPGDIPFMGQSLRAFFIQANEQLTAINDSRPPASLRWYFSAQPTYEYFQEMFSDASLGIDCYFHPYSDSMAHYVTYN